MFENLLKEFRVEPAYGGNVGTYKLELCTVYPRNHLLPEADSFGLPLKLLYVNPGDFKNSEKSVKLVWLLLPALRCPHGVLSEKLLRSAQLAILIHVKLCSSCCEECFVTNYGGGSREWSHWWVGLSCMVYSSEGVDEKDE